MAAITIGDTGWKTVISDNVVPANGSYAWYILTKDKGGLEPRAPIVNLEFAAEVNLKEKYFDLSSTYRINNEIIRTAAEYDSLKDALDTWDAGDTRLYLSVKNTWGTELATRGSKASPTVQVQYRGKCFNFRWAETATAVIVGIEFHYTTA